MRRGAPPASGLAARDLGGGLQDGLIELIRDAVLSMTAAHTVDVDLGGGSVSAPAPGVAEAQPPGEEVELRGSAMRADAGDDPRVVAFQLMGADGALHGRMTVTTRLPEGFTEAEVIRLARLARLFGAAVGGESRFDKGFVHSPIGMAVTDADGRYIRVNAAFCQMLGRPLSEVVGTTYRPYTHPDDLAVGERTLRRLAAGAVETFSAEKRYLRPDGSVVIALVNTTAVCGSDGYLAYAIHQLQDITTRRAMEDELRRSAAQLADEAAILELIARGAPLPETLKDIAVSFEGQFTGLRCAFAILDQTGRVATLASPGMERGSALAAADEALPVRTLEREGLWTWSMRTGGSDELVGALVVRSDPARLPTDAERRAAERCLRLASIAVERTRVEEEIRHQALHDQLTGLPNRTLFTERLQHVIRRRGQIEGAAAVLFLDLDRFKVVNDSQGHTDGDALLIGVARRLQSAMRTTDTVARFGGDEFVILCESVGGRAGAEHVAEVIGAALSQPFVLSHGEVVISVSIGIALLTTAHRSPADLIRDADAAMYAAKELGRARAVVFDRAMRARVVRRVDTERELRRALDVNEFHLVFQPLADLRDWHVPGAEALIRWRHPQRGLVNPVDFIGIAEDSGLIEPLGDWVLREACRHAERWAALGDREHPFVVSVNISARQLARRELVDLVAGVLASTGVDPGRLGLEITETAVMEDAEVAVQTMTALRELGVSISIDDFGTGYSSLGYLHRLPADSLKIDRSFVAGIGAERDGAKIVAAIVRMAHDLSLPVVAEGVETVAQLDQLAALGCDAAQGYLLSTPLPAEEVAGILSRRSRADWLRS